MKAQFLQWKRVTSSQHDEPTHKKPLKPVCLAIVRLRRTEQHSSLADEREPPLPNMMSQPTKNLWNQLCLAIARLRSNESTALAMKESHRAVIRGKVQKQAKVAIITARHWRWKAAQHTSILSQQCATPGLQDAPSGNRTRVKGLKAYSTPLCRGGLP